MWAVGAVFWILALPFRAIGFVLRLIAKPGAEITGILAAGFWWLSAVGAKDLPSIDPAHPAASWLANFSADSNVYAAVLTGASVFLMAFIESEHKDDIRELRRRVVELEITLRRMKAAPSARQGQTDGE